MNRTGIEVTDLDLNSHRVVVRLRTGQLAHLPPAKSTLIRSTLVAAVLNVHLFNLTYSRKSHAVAQDGDASLCVTVLRQTACYWYRRCHLKWTYLVYVFCMCMMCAQCDMRDGRLALFLLISAKLCVHIIIVLGSARSRSIRNDVRCLTAFVIPYTCWK